MKASKTSELLITQLLTFQWHQQEIQERDDNDGIPYTLLSLNPRKWEAVVRQRVCDIW